MLVELKGVTLKIEHGRTLGYAHEPQECTGCHTMTIFFVNERGTTTCTECAEGKAR